MGKQWMWKVQHATGKREINTLHVPVGQTIELTMTSEDTIHSFYLPAFRTKQDVLPGRYTTLWFRAKTPGEYHLFCAEYCGTDHSKMGGKVVVMEPQAYQAWLAEMPPDASDAAAGRGGFVRLQGLQPRATASAGRRWRGCTAPPVKLEGGGEATADEAYLRESIVNPSAKLVAGWPPLMPTFQGQLTEEQLFSLVDVHRVAQGRHDGGTPRADRSRRTRRPHDEHSRTTPPPNMTTTTPRPVARPPAARGAGAT